MILYKIGIFVWLEINGVLYCKILYVFQKRFQEMFYN